MSLRIRRLSWVAVLSALCACIVGASVAWACAPSSWGWSAPSTPESTPTSGGDAGGGAAAATAAAAPAGAPAAAAPAAAPAASLAPAQATASQPAQSQPAKSPASSPAKQPAQSPANRPSQAFVPRSATGVAAPSVAQSSGSAAQSASSGRAGAARSHAAKKGGKAITPSRSTATVQAATDGSAWSAAGGKSPSLMPAASDAASPTTNAGTQLGWGAALLGLGLVGLFGGLAFAQTRRRRSLARR